ncbi:P-loop containing nucleoside triphosphate hydrolase protein [Flagelloscypha sp. PMI_526]|nr:P-loop containing nucleoside triphosphate hydrolase protein [Flagelloscypha sp. PMI_526]
MDTLKTLLTAAAPSMGAGPYGGYGNSNGLIDGMKWVMLGGTVETARRLSSGAHFSEDEPPYDWLMLWLSRRPEWQHSREFETTTRITTPGGFKARGIGEFGDEDADEGMVSSPADDVSKPQTRVVFQPTFDTTHTIYWKGHWLRVKRSRRPDRYGYTDNETLSISVVARNNSILKQLVLRAKREYEAEAVTRIQIYFADQYGGWRWTDSRHKRPLSSIVLMPGVKEMLVNDTKDFLASEKWYADRGVPYRRGYLLHGVPGSGKSSLIHALAGELGLDIYVVSLSASWVSDATLSTLLGRIPSRCMLLLEDLDAAFTRSLNREKKEKKRRRKEKKKAKEQKKDGENKEEGPSPPPRRRNKNGEALSDQNTLTLSGLLNALDGVAASEGRLLFATTNHLTKLDPALSRPGRMDVWVEFRNASRPQSEGLFRNFWPVEDVEPATPAATEDEEKELREAGVTLPEGELVGDLVPPEAQRLPVEDDTRPSIFNKLSTPISVFSDLFNGGSTANPTTSVKQEEVNPPALKFTSSTSSAVGGHSRRTSIASSSDDTLASAITGSGIGEKKKLDRATLEQLAVVFGDSIPENEFSVAALQGYLLKHKSNAFEAAYGAAEWVVQEKETKAKLEKKKKEREAKRKVRKEKEKAKRKLEKEKAKKAKEEADKAAAATAAAAAVAAVPAPAPADAAAAPVPAPVAVPATTTPAVPVANPEDSIVIVPEVNASPPPPAELPPAPLPAELPSPPAADPVTTTTDEDSDSDSSDDDSDDDEDESGSDSDSDSDEDEQ